MLLVKFVPAIYFLALALVIVTSKSKTVQLPPGSRYNEILGFLHKFSSDESFNRSPLSQCDLDVASIKIEELAKSVPCDGHFCYKCTDTTDSSKSVLIKCCSEGIQSMLRYESVGITAFARYSPSLVPKIYYYSDEENFVVLEHLGKYNSLKELFNKGNIDIDVATFIGTVMGRNHARTFHLCISDEQRLRYEKFFTNTHHAEQLDTKIFRTCLNMLSSLSSDAILDLDREGKGVVENRVDLPKSQQITPAEYLQHLRANFSAKAKGNEVTDDSFVKAIKRLRFISSSKQTLTHGGLQSHTILYSMEDSVDKIDSLSEISLKLVDFESASFAAAGVDLGLFLSNYIWYYVAHSSGSARRALCNGFIQVLDAYRNAFRAQIRTSDKGAIEVDKLVNECIIDGLGFAGLYMFYHCMVVDPEDPVAKHMSLEEVPGYTWGDSKGRERSVKRRTLSVVKDLFDLFLSLKSNGSGGDDKFEFESESEFEFENDIDNDDDDDDGRYDYDSGFLKFDTIREILKKDDTALVSDHITEFW